MLPKLSNQNAQGEYYLTDIIAMYAQQGNEVNALCIDDEIEVQGVNDKRQLAALERAYQQRQADRLLDSAVTLIDPARIDVRGRLEVGTDVSIDVNCIFQGNVTLGNHVTIGANCIIGENSAIAGCVGMAGSTKIGKNCIFAGGVLVNGHIEIADGTQFHGGTVVTRGNSEPGVYASAGPLQDVKKWRKNSARLRQLDEIASRVKTLEKKLDK